MVSDETKLEPIQDTLNPDPPRFGMPWYIILILVSISAFLFMIPHCRVFGFLFCPCTLAFGWWLCRKDHKEPHLMIHDLALPSEYDPGKD